MRILTWVSTIAAAVIATKAGASQSLPEKEYLKALKLADQKVQRLKDLRSRGAALSSGMVKLLFGRYYQPGDSWDVAAWQFDRSQLNHPPSLHTSRGRNADSTAPGVPISAQGTFHYEVDKIQAGTIPQISLKVTQTENFGMGIVDARVKAIKLLMNDGIEQTEKFYSIEDDSQWVRVFPDSLHTRISALELFPLDVPNIPTAEKKLAFRFPDLPFLIRSYFEKFGHPPDLNRSSWFEQEDFFGRQIQILWQQGDPWPTYIRTTNGIALLIRKGAR